MKTTALFRQHETYHPGTLFNQPVARTPKHKAHRSGWARRLSELAIATPSWADLKALCAVRAAARYLTVSTGTRHAVDHIVPLNHPLVCGLNVPCNVQPIEYELNARKSNLHWPDMWMAQERLL
jgi:hypothetical protein